MVGLPRAPLKSWEYSVCQWRAGVWAENMRGKLVRACSTAPFSRFHMQFTFSCQVSFNTFQENKFSLSERKSCKRTNLKLLGLLNHTFSRLYLWRSVWSGLVSMQFLVCSLEVLTKKNTFSSVSVEVNEGRHSWAFQPQIYRCNDADPVN